LEKSNNNTQIKGICKDAVVRGRVSVAPVQVVCVVGCLVMVGDGDDLVMIQVWYDRGMADNDRDEIYHKNRACSKSLKIMFDRRQLVIQNSIYRHLTAALTPPSENNFTTALLICINRPHKNV
jgi:hypothetical protein